MPSWRAVWPGQGVIRGTEIGDAGDAQQRGDMHGAAVVGEERLGTVKQRHQRAHGRPTREIRHVRQIASGTQCLRPRGLIRRAQEPNADVGTRCRHRP